MLKQKRNPDIKYINHKIPDFQVPQAKGTRYQARLPDTLDLAERARLAVHGMTATTDAHANAEIYWHANFGWKPPTMYHDINDWCEYKWYAPSVLLRQTCGSDESLEVEWHRMANLLQMQGADGLLYIPVAGRPWARDAGIGGVDCDLGTGSHIMGVGMLGRMLEAAGTYWHLTGDRQWKRLGNGVVGGLRKLAVDKNEFAYFDKGIYAPGDTAEQGPIPPPFVSSSSAWLGHGLTTFYRMTGNEQALQLAYKLAKFYQLGHSGFVGPNGEFRINHRCKSTNPAKPVSVHFHANTQIRMLLLNAGIAADDREMIELAQLGYEYGKKHGETLMGYFPENVHEGPDSLGRMTCEICEVADMIYLALRQSTTGIADCWDDVDRWVRNMLTEAQLLETGWVYEYSDKHGVPTEKPYSVSENVPDRCRGVWGGFLKPNDWQGDPPNSIMACCVGNAGMQLYRVWRDMITEDNKKNRLSIHLLMNRACSWVDIESHIPYRGQVDVRLKRSCEVALRIPEWTTQMECSCKVNGKDITPIWDGRYMITRANKGDVVSLHCPISERSEKLTIVGKEYNVVVCGNEIVDIDPPGEYCPIFHRPHYRQEETQWRTVERFVSMETVSDY